jgi:AraC-like DNA-binding protein
VIRTARPLPVPHPSEKIASHRVAAQIEDARWLAARGVSPEEIARRVGLSPDTLTRALERHKGDA